MGDVVKWAVILVLGWLVYSWFRAGVNFSAQASPNGWGSNMLYARGSSWMNVAPFSYTQPHSIYANYQPDTNAFTFATGF